MDGVNVKKRRPLHQHRGSGDDLDNSISPDSSSTSNQEKPLLSNVKTTTSTETSSAARSQVQIDRDIRVNLVLWKQPFKTIVYFLQNLLDLLIDTTKKFLQSKQSILLTITLTILYFYGTKLPYIGSQWPSMEKKIIMCLYWVGLGVLSSVGLGTGLHTFLLYLGPMIANVTLAAYECGSTNFPEPPYPDEIKCPTDGSSAEMNIFTIMAKVRLESFMWGAGTAIGELPPYFMARAARLAQKQNMAEEDEDDEFQSEMKEALEEADTSTLFGKGKAFMHNLVNKVGFFGILLAASIPNPLFDLAGITCGHFLIPFWTFFGATVIGKAIVKMHIQMLFVIFLFSKHHVEALVALFSKISPKIQEPFEEFLKKQSEKLHGGVVGDADENESLVKKSFEFFVLSMVIYFVVSIINSMAQSHMAKIQKKKRGK